ncbi:MAG: tetratricopeptide repeat protein, partial [Rubrivivax sp.]|nr:tetratricopeptide repeat protein [Rubrivivax sp.]
MSEIRALLLTDVVDSTKLSEKLGDAAMAEVWAAHDRVARDLLPPWRGREIDKTDGMLLLFDDAVDAVQYALAYHLALAAMAVPLKARAGLHVGPVILRENLPDDVARGAKPLEVDGLAKPTAARVMSLARGAQTLLTPEAREAVDDWLDRSDLQSCSHGHWVLKGVATPVELFEVGPLASAFAPPPDGEKVYRVVRVGERWLPVRQIDNNLPEQLSSFVGRERELGELKALLGKTRLLTLLGMGGLGKTRLALQVAAELMAEYPDGVWFLDLAPLRDDALVLAEAAQTLGVREEPGQPLLQTLCAHLRSRRVLIILDNCEHLLRPSALLAHAILKAAPQVAIIASSRAALRVPGERSYPILPLPVPGKGDSFESLLRSTAVRLFVERAQEHRIDFSFTEAEAPAVAELVARLEGIPLALELAAARVRSMTVADINRRLSDRYQVLTEGSIVLEERQQTLRALVDWSYDLLQPTEQRVLNRLAVFAGGFDLAAAEPVCSDGELPADQVLNLLASLVEKSLLGMEHRAGQARYRLLETLRDYAGEKLAGAGELPVTAARHAEHYFALAKEVRYGLVGPEQAQWVQRGETELDNTRAALALALAGGVDPIIAVKLAVAMQGFWILRGYVGEGRAAVRAALALPTVQATDLAQANALYVAAALATAQSDHAAASQQLEACLALRRKMDNPLGTAATLSTLSLAQLQAGDAAAAIESETEALKIFEQIGNQEGVAIAHLHLGQAASYLGDDDGAHRHLSQSLAAAQAIGQREVEAEASQGLGQLAGEAGQTAAARQWLTTALRLCEESGNKRGIATAQWRLAQVALAAGDNAGARPLLAAAMQAFLDDEMREELLGCLDDTAGLDFGPAAPGLAASLAGFIDSARQRRG